MMFQNSVECYAGDIFDRLVFDFGFPDFVKKRQGGYVVYGLKGPYELSSYSGFTCIIVIRVSVRRRV